MQGGYRREGFGYEQRGDHVPSTNGYRGGGGVPTAPRSHGGTEGTWYRGGGAGGVTSGPGVAPPMYRGDAGAYAGADERGYGGQYAAPPASSWGSGGHGRGAGAAAVSSRGGALLPAPMPAAPYASPTAPASVGAAAGAGGGVGGASRSVGRASVGSSVGGGLLGGQPHGPLPPLMAWGGCSGRARRRDPRRRGSPPFAPSPRWGSSGSEGDASPVASSARRRGRRDDEGGGDAPRAKRSRRSTSGDERSHRGKGAPGGGYGSNTVVQPPPRGRSGMALAIDLPSGPGSRPQKPRETDPRRLAQRAKQIEFGKNTIGYDRYTTEVPRHARTRAHPRTPDKEEKMPKRKWDSLVRVSLRALLVSARSATDARSPRWYYQAWRRTLHKWDPVAQEGEVSVIDELRKEQAEVSAEAAAAAAAEKADAATAAAAPVHNGTVGDGARAGAEETSAGGAAVGAAAGVIPDDEFADDELL